MTDAAHDDDFPLRADRSAERPSRPAPGPGERVGADLPTIEAVGRASEALEYVQRARGHLYSFHQLIGHADELFGDAADMLRNAGHRTEADAIDADVVGRNVLDGRWTFQVVEEFDDLYHQVVVDRVRGLERRLMDGHRHVYEARLKESRRSVGRAGHESRPPAAHSADVITDDPSVSD